MGRLHTMISLAAACGILASAPTAFACQVTRIGSPSGSRTLNADSVGHGGLLKKDAPPAKKGALDDRLVRPRAHVDASAGTLG